ncbi:transmembrane protein PMIS2 [Castor canadensis]|uniref:Transmembrane protein PMIS2 n=1 Tax=Castor canadensis TaxID=51338 RepID=A0AC58L7M3_CASCN
MGPKPKAPKAAAAKPKAAKPKAAKPVAKPKAAQPEAAQPEAAQPKAAQPEAAQPEAAKPEAAQPQAAQPQAAQPEAKGDAEKAEAPGEEEEELFEQTPEELEFYAPVYKHLTIAGIVCFFPLGLAALHFSKKTTEANQNSEWEDAYDNSARTVWLAVYAILVGLGLFYGFFLYV